MPNKTDLLKKLCAKPLPRSFTMRDLNQLMVKCGCVIKPGGRGSAVRYYHSLSGKVLTFDQPHPGKELYPYQIKKVIGFLILIGEIEGGSI